MVVFRNEIASRARRNKTPAMAGGAWDTSLAVAHPCSPPLRGGCGGGGEGVRYAIHAIDNARWRGERQGSLPHSAGENMRLPHHVETDLRPGPARG